MLRNSNCGVVQTFVGVEAVTYRPLEDETAQTFSEILQQIITKPLPKKLHIISSKF